MFTGFPTLSMRLASPLFRRLTFTDLANHIQKIQNNSDVRVLGFKAENLGNPLHDAALERDRL